MSHRGAARGSTFSWRKWCALAVAVLVGTGLGLVLLEPLSRPREVDSARQQVRDFRHDLLSTNPTAEQLAAEAKEVVDRLLERFPNNPRALALGGDVYYVFGDEAEAERCWDRCLTVDADFAPAWRQMGEVARERGEYEKAVSLLRRAIEADRDLTRTLACTLADSLLSCGKIEEAIKVLEQTAHDGSTSSEELFLLGHAYLQSGQCEKARDRLEEALRIDPGSSKAHFGLASVYARLGDAEESRKHREAYTKLKSQELDETKRSRASLRGLEFGDVRPLAVRSYLKAGMIYASHDDAHEAEEHWLRAVALDPQHPEPRAWLKVLYTEQGRTEEALRVWQGGSVAQRKSAGS